jgi:hypothetical protein
VAGPFGYAPSPPTPLLVEDFGAGMMSLNYRTEPLPLRIAPASPPNPQADPNAGDLAHAFRSIARLDPVFSAQPVASAKINPKCTTNCFTFPATPISDGMQPTDPFTPLLQGYEGDKVQIRLLSGAHTSMHDFNMHGLRWKAAPFAENSGYRNSQFIVLSEHFETLFELPRIGAPRSADYIYNPTASYEGLANGIWGLLRSWSPTQRQSWLAPLRQDVPPAPPAPPRPPSGLSTDCARVRPCLREFRVRATTVQKAASQAGLVYNGRGLTLPNGQFDSAHPLIDPFGLVYVLEGSSQPAGGVEPLVLRAAAGDWIHVTLVNDFEGTEPVFTAAASESAYRSAQIPYANPYVNVTLTTSAHVGLHPQLVELDVTKSDGANAGNNPVQTVGPHPTGPPQSIDYWWYAGKIENSKPVPVEFGSVNLMPADPLMQVYHGLFGALIIEPAGSRWIEDPATRTAATVFDGDRVYREFVLMIQNDVSIQLNGESLYGAQFPLSAFNYRTEPFFYRFGADLEGPLGLLAPNDWKNLSGTDLGNVANLQMTTVDTTQSTSNRLVGGDPVTPILRAPAGMPVRIRLLSPGGIGDNQQVFELTGHVWQEAPFTAGSTKIGFSPTSNWTGTTPGFGPTTTYEVVLEDAPNGQGGAAGGRFRVPGDYLYRSWTANQFQAGTWGLFRVAPSGGTRGWPDTVGVLSVQANPSGGYDVSGFTTVSPRTGAYAPSVALDLGGSTATATVRNGLWSFHGNGAVPGGLTVRSPLGGQATWGTVVTPAQKTEAAMSRSRQPLSKKPAVRTDRRPRQPR